LTSSDLASLVIYSAGVSGDGKTSIRGVVGTVDYVLRTLPNRVDVEASINRVVDAGLGTVEDDVVVLTPAGLELFENARGAIGDPVTGTLQRLADALTTEDRPGSWHLDRAVYDAAVRAYHDRK